MAGALGPGAHVLNACADRYHFAVGLAACLLTDKVSLLPSTHTPEVMRQLRRFAADLVCLTDEADCDIELPLVRYPPQPSAPAAAGAPAAPGSAAPAIDSARLVAYVFTSGSTGTPVPHPKTYGRLAACVHEEALRLGLGAQACAIIATVPPQHMYGFESSLLLALLNGHAFCAERPFYPADIAAVLAAGVPRPRMLVSTPVHLRALLGSGVALPEIDLIVCSTAPLAQQLALEVEARCHTHTRSTVQRRPARSRCVDPRTAPSGSCGRASPSARARWRDLGAGGHIEQPTRMCDVLEMTRARHVSPARTGRRPRQHRRQAQLPRLPQSPAELHSGLSRRRVLSHRRGPHRGHRAGRGLCGGARSCSGNTARTAAPAHRSGVPAKAAPDGRAPAAQQHRQAPAGSIEIAGGGGV